MHSMLLDETHEGDAARPVLEADEQRSDRDHNTVEAGT
jgi:hypothetical protein